MQRKKKPPHEINNNLNLLKIENEDESLTKYKSILLMRPESAPKDPPEEKGERTRRRRIGKREREGDQLLKTFSLQFYSVFVGY